MPKTAPMAPHDPSTLIRTIRGQRVILDSDLAKIYGVPTFRFNEAIKRNRQRFPEDFHFQLTREEFGALTSQSAILKPGRGQHRKYLPYVFTEHGALQAANVLNSQKARTVSIYVIRAFIRMREELSANQAIAKRLTEIDNTLLTHDAALRDSTKRFAHYCSRRRTRHGAKSDSKQKTDFAFPPFPIKTPTLMHHRLTAPRPSLLTTPPLP